MPYVQRDGNENIIGVFAQPQPGSAEEYLADDHADVLAFLAPKVRTISRRQFYTALALAETITAQEALDGMAGNALPAALAAMVDAVQDPTEQFVARGLLLAASDFRRDHPLVSQIGAAQGMTEQQIDAFFATAASL